MEKPWVALLALPTMGLALAITVVSTYVPVLARRRGVLLAAAQIAPFLAAAVLLLICITTFSMLLLRRAGVPDRGRTRPLSLARPRPRSGDCLRRGRS